MFKIVVDLKSPTKKGKKTTPRWKALKVVIVLLDETNGEES